MRRMLPPWFFPFVVKASEVSLDYSVSAVLLRLGFRLGTAMKKTCFSLAATATLVLSSPFLMAQAKPSPYEGVSTPPSSDAITTTEQAPATPPAVITPAPAPAQAAIRPAPAPAAQSNPDAGIIETPLPASSEDYAPHRAAALKGRSFDSPTDNRD